MSDGFTDHLQDLFAEFGAVDVRRLFGGHGLYRDGLIIGVLADDVLYLKTDDATRARFEAAGGTPFVFASAKPGAQGQPITTSYWSLPGEAMESAQAMQPWAQLAHEAALRKPSVARQARRAKQAKLR